MNIIFYAGKGCRIEEDKEESRSTSHSSRISANHMRNVIDELKFKDNRDSTVKNYYSIWKSFNQFLIRLDHKPECWEDRVLLYCGFLIENKRKLSTIKSYISAIKWILKSDGYEWNQK